MTLAAAYARCRRLNARHGRSFYLATLLLPRWKRRHVHALYGLTRHADDLVDSRPDLTTAERAKALDGYATRLFAALDGEPTDDPLLPAVVHTVAAFGIDRGALDRFLRAMAMDTERDGYETYEDLLSYMDGSAAVVGEMLLPILEPVGPGAIEPARELGFAFQLTNFLRDIGEDLARGRVYLPAAELRAFGVSRAELAGPEAGPRLRALIGYQITRARGHYARAAAGIDLLAPSSRPCIRAAHALYGGILDEIERRDYQVLRTRVAVPLPRRLRIALGAAAGVRAAR